MRRIGIFLAISLILLSPCGKSDTQISDSTAESAETTIENTEITTETSKEGKSWYWSEWSINKPDSSEIEVQTRKVDAEYQNTI